MLCRLNDGCTELHHLSTRYESPLIYTPFWPVRRYMPSLLEDLRWYILCRSDVSSIQVLTGRLSHEHCVSRNVGSRIHRSYVPNEVSGGVQLRCIGKQVHVQLGITQLYIRAFSLSQKLGTSVSSSKSWMVLRQLLNEAVTGAPSLWGYQ